MADDVEYTNGERERGRLGGKGGTFLLIPIEIRREAGAKGQRERIRVLGDVSKRVTRLGRASGQKLIGFPRGGSPSCVACLGNSSRGELLSFSFLSPLPSSPCTASNSLPDPSPPLRATSFDLNPAEEGLFSTVSRSRLVIGTLREKPRE